MAKEDFPTNLLRAAVANLTLQSGLLAAREMFGRSYFSFGAGEKMAVDQAVFALVVANYHALTPQALASQEAPKEAGFLNRAAKQSEETSKPPPGKA